MNEYAIDWNEYIPEIERIRFKKIHFSILSEKSLKSE